MSGVLVRAFERRSTLDETTAWGLIKRLRGGIGETAVGITVTPDTALRYSALFACIRILAEDVASLPLITYTRNGRAKERATAHPLYPILHDVANPEMTAYELRFALQAHLALRGNAYAEIVYNNAGQITELWPRRPDRMEVLRNDMGDLVYRYTMPERSGQTYDYLPAERVLHLRAFALDGLMGISPISLAKQSIALGMAAEEFGARFFGNGTNLGVVLRHPNKLDDDAFDRLKESWVSSHEGLSNAHRVAILEEGMEIEKIGVAPNDAQFLETRKFQVNDIARWYRMPLHKLQDLEHATFSNIEHQSIEYLTSTLQPWLVAWEQRLGLSLLTSNERNTIFIKHLIEGFLRGDTKSRYESYAIARNWGWLSVNDVREREDMNPVTGGDVYLSPMNMVPADQLSAAATQQARSLALLDAVEDGTPINMTLRSKAVAHTNEERAKASADNRHKLQISYERVYRDVATRIVRREAQDIGEAVGKYLRKRSQADFNDWLDEFYRGHIDYIRRQVMPMALSYGELVANEAASEVKLEEDLQGPVQRFMQAYVDTYAIRHVAIHADKLRHVMSKAQADGVDVADALDTELKDWPETRGANIAKNESVRTNNAVSVAVYGIAGVLRLRWHSFGESCPYCKNLNGRVVGIQENFLNAGEDFKPDGADVPLRPGRSIRHAPAHDGCDCMVGAG